MIIPSPRNEESGPAHQSSEMLDGISLHTSTSSTTSVPRHDTTAVIEMQPLTRRGSNLDDWTPDNEDGEGLVSSRFIAIAGSSEGLAGLQRGGFWSWLPPTWYDWLFPPNVPRSCQLLRKENLAVPASYLLVGLLQGNENV